MGIGDDAMRHLVGAGGVGHGLSRGRELRGENESARRGDALEHLAATNIGDDDVLLIALVGHVMPPSLRHERPSEYAGSSRSGRCCRTWHHRSARLMALGSLPA